MIQLIFFLLTMPLFCEPISHLPFCADSQKPPCLSVSDSEVSLNIKTHTLSLDLIANLIPHRAYALKTNKSSLKIILVLNSGDRLNTLEVRMYELSSEYEISPLALPVKHWEYLNEGSVNVMECIFEGQLYPCLELNRAIIHYNSAPPLLLETARLIDVSNLNQDWFTEEEQSKPETAWQHLNLAKELYARSQFDQAEKHYREGLYLLKNDPVMYPDGTHARLRFDFGMSLLKVQKLNEAKTVLSSVLNQFKNTSAASDLLHLIGEDPDLIQLFSQ